VYVSGGKPSVDAAQKLTTESQQVAETPAGASAEAGVGLRKEDKRALRREGKIKHEEEKVAQKLEKISAKLEGLKMKPAEARGYPPPPPSQFFGKLFDRWTSPLIRRTLIKVKLTDVLGASAAQQVRPVCQARFYLLVGVQVCTADGGVAVWRAQSAGVYFNLQYTRLKRSAITRRISSSGA